MIEDDALTAKAVKESCKILDIKYPTTKDGSAVNMPPIKKACMLLSMMAWTYYKTDKLVAPSLTAESTVPRTS
jgi:hypothetical protein